VNYATTVKKWENVVDAIVDFVFRAKHKIINNVMTAGNTCDKGSCDKLVVFCDACRLGVAKIVSSLSNVAVVKQAFVGSMRASLSAASARPVIAEVVKP